ncbi:MAG: carboxypeptidase regulatory-like domain-containing protein [Bryobacterales bacterium]|nr:carboxypeptidase regulatory-like domain-containing protein [Bryobacterales bacterium]
MVVLLAGAATVTGQTLRSAVVGYVADSDGRPVQGVEVTARQEETGLQRRTVSNSEGTYSLQELPLGSYEVTFERSGFRKLQYSSVLQSAGQTRTLNATLEIAQLHQSIEVRQATPALDETTDTLGARVGKRQIGHLPINGHNWSNLTALTAGAIDAGGSNQRTIRFAGRAKDDNNFTYDGVDATNIVNQSQPAFVRLAIPTDTIAEFTVESMLSTAASGQTTGGQMNLTSPSGTNQFHGSLFEFFRNDVLDARDPFGADRPAFRMNQFGASVGGPVVKDRIFFFAAYEGIRQTLGQSLNGFVPTEAFRSQVAAQSPVLARIVNAYPLGQTQITPQVAAFAGKGTQWNHEDSGMVRLDDRFTDHLSVFIRLNMDAALSSVPSVQSGQYLNDRLITDSRPVNGVINLLDVLSPTVLNEVQFGFNRGTLTTANNGDNGLIYSVSVPGFTPQSFNKTRPEIGNSFSFGDRISMVKGRHVLKAGVEIRRIQFNSGNTESGAIGFASLADFAANRVNSASYAAELPMNGLRKTGFYGYIQDEYKWRPNVTLNLGLRYSFFNRFHEAFGRAVPFDFATCGAQGFCPAGAEFGEPNLTNFDPRVAIAWAPTALGGNTVIRSGFGLYHGDGQVEDQSLPITNEVKQYSLTQATIPNLSFPLAPFISSAPGIASAKSMDRRRKDAYTSQWGLSVQQLMPQNFVGTVSYVGSTGTHLYTKTYVNMLNPVTGLRPYPNFGLVEFRGNQNNSSFQALQASLRRSFERGLLLAVNYMWSHEIDDGSLGAGDAVYPQNTFCRACERASGNFDARHVFNGNGVYQLPFGRGRRNLSQPGMASALLGGWDLSSIFTARTGMPVNVTIDRRSSDVPGGNSSSQRPDLVPGVSLTPPQGSTVANWINPAAFAAPVSRTFGNAGRNLVRGPGAWQLDLSLTRNIQLSEPLRLQFRADAFNLFNHPQYGVPQSNLSAGPGNFGAILTTLNTSPVGTGTPRQIQFMLRLSF